MALFFGIKKLRAYPGFTSTICPGTTSALFQAMLSSWLPTNRTHLVFLRVPHLAINKLQLDNLRGESKNTEIKSYRVRSRRDLYR